MKKLLLILLALPMIGFGQELFEKTNTVDEFGDKVGETLRNVSNGTFSNSATNNSALRVHTILELTPEFKTIEDFKLYQAKILQESGYDEKEIKKLLKYAQSSYKIFKNINGTLRFDFFEYGDIKASMIGIKSGIISIKTSEGEKIKAVIGEYSFSNGSLTINGYNENTGGASGIKNQIKYGFYDWAQTEIYNTIINSKEPIMVVISFGNSTYKFALKQ
tara:strand:+ start:271 stop:927 length:657 start_codon:yes stop_codon:yes gene_type:complete